MLFSVLSKLPEIRQEFCEYLHVHVLSTRKKTPSVVTQTVIIKRFAIKLFVFSSFGRYFKVLTGEVTNVLLVKMFLREKLVFCFIFCSNLKLGGKLRRVTRNFLGQGCFFGIRAL